MPAMPDHLSLDKPRLMSATVSRQLIRLNMNLLCGIRYELENKKPLLSSTEALLLPARQSSININIESIVFIFSCLCGRSRMARKRRQRSIIFSCLCGRSPYSSMPETSVHDFQLPMRQVTVKALNNQYSKNFQLPMRQVTNIKTGRGF